MNLWPATSGLESISQGRPASLLYGEEPAGGAKNATGNISHDKGFASLAAYASAPSHHFLRISPKVEADQPLFFAIEPSRRRFAPLTVLPPLIVPPEKKSRRVGEKRAARPESDWGNLMFQGQRANGV